MKKLLNIQPLSDWFGYTRRERRSTFILLFIILIVILSRYSVPEKNIEVFNAVHGYHDSVSFAELSSDKQTRENIPFGFDQNATTYDNIFKKAPHKREAKTLIRYRPKIEKFREADSLPSIQAKTRLNLNKCDTAALIALPGIGPVLSVRIIKYRNLIGGFARVDQLKEVYGLPEETYQIVKQRVYADSSEVRKIKINSSDYKGLSRIPYIEKYEVSAILKYRELAVRINSMEDLLENKILSPEKGKKVWAYIDFQ